MFIVAFLIFWPSAFSLSLLLFRQQLRPFRSKIILSSLIMAQVTFILQSGFIPEGMALPIFQPLATWLCFWLIFRIKFSQSLTIFVSFYGLNIIVEIIFYIFLSHLTDSSFITLAKESVVLPFLFLSVFNIVLCFFLIKFRLGFSFIRLNNKQTFPDLVPILMISILCACSAIVSLYLYDAVLVLLISFLLVSMGLVFYRIYKREISE